MPKKNKTLCVDDLRHAEYYGMQPVFDELYHRSLEGENFTDLMDLILSRDNILLAYRNIKASQMKILLKKKKNDQFQLCAQLRVCSQAGGIPVYPRFSQPDNSESWDDAGNGI